MLISVAEFLGSCMVAQFSLWKVEVARFGFRAFGFCCESTLMPSSFSAFEAGAAAIVGFGATVAGMDSFFCFLDFWSCWLPGKKLPTTT